MLAPLTGPRVVCCAQVYPFITDARAQPYWFPFLPSYWCGGSNALGAKNVAHTKVRLLAPSSLTVTARH